jgi:integrase
MASTKIVLRKKQNKDGTYPLALRITKDRKSSFVHLGHHLQENFWDAEKGRVKKSHPNSVRLNNLLSKKLVEAEDNLIDLEVQKNDISSAVIKRKIQVPKNEMFFARAEHHLENLQKQKKYNRYSADKGKISVFRQFLNNADIPFPSINVPLLTSYRVHLKSKGLATHTIITYLSIIQNIFNQAISDGMVDKKYYPFDDDKLIIKPPRSLKVGLSSDEVKIIETLELPKNSYLNHARNIWLTSFYFAGMRVSDVLRLKWPDFQNDRLYYTMGKNAKAGSLKLPEKVIRILEEYKGQKHAHHLVFPDLEMLPDINDSYAVEKQIKATNAKLNPALKEIATKAGITQKLTMHIARHTFGNISGDKIPIQMLQKLYRHSDIKTTMGYQANFIHKDADDALDAVISF